MQRLIMGLLKARKPDLDELAINGMRFAAGSLKEQFLTTHEIEGIIDSRKHGYPENWDLNYVKCGMTVDNLYGGVLTLNVRRRDNHDGYPLISIGLMPEMVLSAEEMEKEKALLSLHLTHPDHAIVSPYASAFSAIVVGVCVEEYYGLMFTRGNLDFRVSHGNYKGLQEKTEETAKIARDVVKNALAKREELKPLVEGFVNSQLRLYDLFEQEEFLTERMIEARQVLVRALSP